MSYEMLELIKTRRSIRKFQDRPVEDKVLDAVLEAGTYAPTGRGAQSPVIVAVEDKETKKKLSEMNRAIMGAETDPYYGAPVIVLVLASPERSTCVEDGSCVLENMMLAAHALGLGSCWVHREYQIFESEEGKALLKAWGLDEQLRGVGSIALGYPEGEAPKAAARKEGYIVHI